MKQYIKSKINANDTSSDAIRVDTNDVYVKGLIAIHRSAEYLGKLLKLQLADYPVTRTQYIILTELKLHSGSMKPTDISRISVLPKQTTSRVLDSLEKAGLIRRKINKDDHRSFLVTLSPKGWELIERIWVVRKEMAHEAMSILDKQELEKLNATLTRLMAHIINHV